MMVGLTRRGHTGGSLLNQINGVPTNGSGSISTRRFSRKLATTEPEHHTANGNGRCQLDGDGQEDDLYREPDSSDDDVDSNDIRPTVWREGNARVAGRHVTDSDDDGFGPIRRRPAPEMKSSRIKSSPIGRSGRKAKGSIIPSENVMVDNKTSSSQGFEEAYGFSNQLNRKRKVTTYSSQSKRRSYTGSQGNDSSSPEAKFKPSRIIPDLHNSQTPEKKLKVRNLDDLDLSSPIKAAQFKSRLNLSPSVETESKDLVLCRPEVISDDELSSPPDSPEMKKYPYLIDEDESQLHMPVFRMPVNFDYPSKVDSIEVDDGNDTSLENNEHKVTNYDPLPILPEAVQKAICPMCGEVVEPDHLKAFSKGRTMNIRSQTNFCRAHKRKTARDEWAEKRYPTIDWNNLDARIAAHYSFLRDLLDGAPCPSRDILTENVRLGKDRTLLQAMTNGTISLSPGYYGTRGMRAMCENIMQEFSPQLRRIAVKDRVVAARGVSGYVQSVLVPELAVKLIAEDMSIGDEEARVLMSESAGMGELLNEEVEDVVIWAGDGEGEGEVLA